MGWGVLAGWTPPGQAAPVSGEGWGVDWPDPQRQLRALANNYSWERWPGRKSTWRALCRVCDRPFWVEDHKGEPWRGIGPLISHYEAAHSKTSAKEAER